MNWKINIILIAFLMCSCKKENTEKTSSYTSNYLINANELLELASHKKVKILDFRKKETYQKEHIKNAIQIWRSDLENPNYNYGGMMPTSKHIEALFSKLGIHTEDILVIYDDKGLCEAARLWWILQIYNFKNVKLLNGGINAWKSVNGSISNLTTKFPKTAFELSKNAKKEFYISKEEVKKALDRNMVLLDTRSKAEFNGEKHKKGAAKPGRIPNSINIDWADAINFNGNQLIKPIEELEKIYSKLNIKKNDSIILYCHSGVRSAHTTFVLTELLGYKNVKNYDGSWTEWSHFDNLPHEIGSSTQKNNYNE
jgi:thiosulfate/3-mercaptopyruvate sulfurtransferase